MAEFVNQNPGISFILILFVATIIQDLIEKIR